MNVLRASLISAVTSSLLLTVPMLGSVNTAQANVQKCIAPGGEVIYTNVGCDANNASPAAMPSHVARAIARESVADAGIGFDVQGNQGAPSGLGPRSRASGCARSPEQLQADFGYAMASRDINRISENYHWVGLSQRDARGILSKLESMAKERVAQTRLLPATGSAFIDGKAVMDGNAGHLQLALASGSPVQMAVTEYRGCYFAKF